MQPVGYRSIDLSLEQKVLICLKTLGWGGFQNCIKDFIDVAQPNVSRILSDFIETVVKLAPHFIFMQRKNNEICNIKRDFYKIASFPGVIVCIDGLHIQIIAPHEDEFAYVNRKKFHFINIQGICNANLLFLDVVAKWPGSSHHSFILQTAQVNDDFENGKYVDSWLLGDNWYPLKNWLMTPITQPATSAERNFNEVYRKTRCLIERAFGVLKSKWKILDHTGGSMCCSPTKVAKITITCCVLHNICRKNGTPILGPNSADEALDNAEGEDQAQSSTTSALRQRKRLIDMLQHVDI